MKNVLRFTEDTYKNYAYGNPQIAALGLNANTEDYLIKVKLYLQEAGQFLAPAIKEALIKDITKEINKL